MRMSLDKQWSMQDPNTCIYIHNLQMYIQNLQIPPPWLACKLELKIFGLDFFSCLLFSIVDYNLSYIVVYDLSSVPGPADPHWSFVVP